MTDAHASTRMNDQEILETLDRLLTALRDYPVVNDSVSVAAVVAAMSGHIHAAYYLAELLPNQHA